MSTLVLLLFLLLVVVVCVSVSVTHAILLSNIKHVPGDPQSVQLANATTCIVIEYYIGGSVPPHTKDRNL